MALETTSSVWETPTFDVVVNQGLGWTIVIGCFIIATFTCLKFSWEYFKYSLGAAQGNDVSVVWDWQEITRVIALITILGCYKPLAEGVTMAIKQINDITASKSETRKKLEHSANVWYFKTHYPKEYEQLLVLKDRKADAEKKGDNARIEVIEQELKRIREEGYSHTNGTEQGEEYTEEEKAEGAAITTIDPGSWFENAIIGLVGLLATAIKFAVGALIKIIFKIGILLGPLAISFGVIWRDKPQTWFNSMMTIGFVFTTLNLLDMCYLYFIDQYIVNDVSMGETLAFNLALIASYWSVFKITAMFIGQTGMNQIMNRGISLAAGAVAAGIGIGGKIAGGASGGSNTAEKIASSISKEANKTDRPG